MVIERWKAAHLGFQLDSDKAHSVTCTGSVNTTRQHRSYILRSLDWHVSNIPYNTTGQFAFLIVPGWTFVFLYRSKLLSGAMPLTVQARKIIVSSDGQLTKHQLLPLSIRMELQWLFVGQGLAIHSRRIWFWSERADYVRFKQPTPHRYYVPLPMRPPDDRHFAYALLRKDWRRALEILPWPSHSRSVHSALTKEMLEVATNWRLSEVDFHRML